MYHLSQHRNVPLKAVGLESDIVEPGLGRSSRHFGARERVLPIGERAALAIGGLAIAAGFALLLAPDLMGLRS